MSLRCLRVLYAAAFVLGAAVPASAQPVIVSVATDGSPGDAPSLLPAMSATGRFVAFASFASNLAPADTNGFGEDVYLRDRDTDADGVFDEPGAVSTVRVSQRGAVAGNGRSSDPAITADGRFVVFTSFASNLFSTGQPPLAVSVVLRWDRLTGDIALVSQTTAAEPLLAARSVRPEVSNDGNRVVFLYGGSIPAEVALGHRGVVFCRDIAAGTLTQVSTVPLVEGADRAESNESPTISGDGGTIAYGVVARMTTGTPFVVGATVHVVDPVTGAVRVSYPGVQPRLSRDAGFLSFVSLLPALQGAGGPMVRLHLGSGERRATGLVGAFEQDAWISPSGRYVRVGSQLADFGYGSYLLEPLPDRFAHDTTDTTIAFRQVPAGSQIDQIVVTGLTTRLDRDTDGLNDHWETTFGLDTLPGSGATGPSGAGGDPDSDGLTNAEEFARGSNPHGTHARYLAEGAAGSFFTTRIAIVNAADVQANVAVRFEVAGGGTIARAAWVPARSRLDFDSRAQGLGTASFATVVESTQPVVVDRLMTWGDSGAVPYGSHAEASGAAPGTSWFLAEGSTVFGFQLFYLLQNPQATPTTATVRYLLPSGPPLVRTYDLPARSRTTVYVNSVPGLESTDVSAEITATQPIAVERSMYRSSGGQVFALGHAAAAVAQPSASWFFGEGATGAFFDTFLLVANPSAQPATVQVDYLRDEGGVAARSYTVPANSRFSVFVDGEPGMGGTNFGTRVTSSVPIVAERAMYWAGGFFDYYEGHVSAGATQTGRRWLLAAGDQGGAYGAQTFVLIANTGPTAVTVRLATLPESGAAVLREFSIPAQSRLTVPVSMLAPEVRGGIEILEATPQSGLLVVEGATYWSVAGQPFGAGASWPATRLQ